MHLLPGRTRPWPRAVCSSAVRTALCSLDAKSGCIRWTFSAAGGVRTALAVARAGGSRLVVYFADTAANAYALDADTGRQLWVRRVDDHPSARITGSPTFFEGRLYVPVSSCEEAQGADPQYPCCTFRGSVAALDAESGAVEWKTYMIASRRSGEASGAGVPLWGPSGAGIWSAPTVDASRRLLYVATGNAYSAPATSSSDASLHWILRPARFGGRDRSPQTTSMCPTAGQAKLPGVSRSRL